jgi:hypothetical protein
VPGVPAFPAPDDPAYWPTVSAIADGHLPDGVDPESPRGRYLRRWIEHVRADVARAPMLSPIDLASVVVLLRGPSRAA